QLADQWREVGVAGNDDEGIDMLLRVTKIQSIDDHADVCRVLARHADVWDLDQLESGFMHCRLELLVAIPVAVGLLGDDAALEQEALENWLDFEPHIIRIADTQCD